MKSILYVGATLMIGASIYGFADYKKSSHDKQFENMYDESREVKPAVITTKTEEAELAPADIKEVKKAPVKKRGVYKEDVPEPISPIAEEERLSASSLRDIEKAEVAITPSDNKNVTEKLKKRKKLSSKYFSRAPIREEMEERSPAKKELMKTETKKL